jgi:hypothetical protein
MKLSILVILGSVIGAFAAPIHMHTRDKVNHAMDQAASDAIDKHLAMMSDPDAESAINTHLTLAQVLSEMPESATSKRYDHDPQAEAQVVRAMTHHLITRQDDVEPFVPPKVIVCAKFPQASFCKRSDALTVIQSLCASQPDSLICKPRIPSSRPTTGISRIGAICARYPDAPICPK